MWFSKLLNRRREEADAGEEPARFPTVVDSSHGPSTGPTTDMKRNTPVRGQPKGGFDPYNSGTFQKKNAWERVVRK
jgi:hypothetical protein